MDLPKGGGDSVAAWLRRRTPNLSAVADKAEDAGFIHRLDLDTSGLLIAAKSRAAWEALRGSLRKGAIEKQYLAIIDGRPPTGQRMTGWIGSSSRSARSVRVFADKPRQKFRVLPAETIFENVRYSEALGSSLVTATAPTARRHQIRAHAAAWGFPLTGDTLYGSVKTLPADIFGPRAFFLHAARLCFPHPLTGERRVITAPLAPNIKALFVEASA